MHAEKERLASAVQAMIASGPEGDPRPFDALCLDLFQFQYENNAPYRTFCQGHGVEPTRVTHWRDIPAFPTDAFKKELVTSFPLVESVMAQLTRGTTANRRGQIFRDAIGRTLIFAANHAMTAAYLFPDFDPTHRCQILILAPSPEMAPSMGMAMGMAMTQKAFGSPDSTFLLDKTGINLKGLLEALEASEQERRPVALIGATGAFVYFFQVCRKKGISFHLPKGSRISDGGGYRGRFGKMDRDDYRNSAQEILNIPDYACINVLGMAESATNYFENSLRAHVLGKSTTSRRMIPPPWTRVTAVHLEDLTPLPPGEVGILCHYDLVNLPTVVAVQSDNLGMVDPEGGFHLIGRAKLENGRASPLPAERAVGPLGDNRLFRFLEHYVNYSIRFKSGRITGRKPTVTEENMPGACPCGDVAEKMVESTENRCETTQ